jgi:preprotein translocase subunit SecG
VKMQISGGFAPETSGATSAGPASRAGNEGERRPLVRPAYALAVIWVVIGLFLYVFQILKLIDPLG